MLPELDEVVGRDPRLPAGLGGLWYGVHPAYVVDIKDPDSQGRVKVALPWARDPGSESYEAWARLATLMAGPGRGSWFVPDVGDEVLIAFEAGDPRRPYVVGALWNGKGNPPESMDGAGRNNKKVLRTRGGLKVTFDDNPGQENIVIETPAGQKLTMNDGSGGSIELKDDNGNSIKLEMSGVTILTAGRINLTGASLSLTASTVAVNAGVAKFSGTVKADAIVTNSVASSSYTPGAGNIW